MQLVVETAVAEVQDACLDGQVIVRRERLGPSVALPKDAARFVEAQGCRSGVAGVVVEDAEQSDFPLAAVPLEDAGLKPAPRTDVVGDVDMVGILLDEGGPGRVAADL